VHFRIISLLIIIISGGAVIVFRNTSNVEFNVCKFYYNKVTTGYAGGAITMVGNVTFNRVTFIGNSGVGVWNVKGALFAAQNASMRFIDCSFYHNVAATGGALYLSGNGKFPIPMLSLATVSLLTIPQRARGGGAIKIHIYRM
jgi:hypothetical protein